MRHRHLSRQARAPTGARAQSGSTPPTARPARPPPYPLGPAGHARAGPAHPSARWWRYRRLLSSATPAAATRTLRKPWVVSCQAAGHPV